MTGLKDILSDPSAAFDEPSEVLRAPSLSSDDKDRVLRQWRYDLVQLQTASSESLTGDSDPGVAIRKIDECLRQLKAATE